MSGTEIDDPLDFEAVFAEYEATSLAANANQQGGDVVAPTQPDALPAQQTPFPELESFDGHADIAPADDVMAQEFFSADVQAQFPSISEIMSAGVAAAQQPEIANHTIPAETAAEKKKPRSRKKKAPAMAQADNKVNSQSVPVTMPNPAQQQMTPPTIEFNGVMTTDPFIATTAPQDQVSGTALP